MHHRARQDLGCRALEEEDGVSCPAPTGLNLSFVSPRKDQTRHWAERTGAGWHRADTNTSLRAWDGRARTVGGTSPGTYLLRMFFMS